LGEEARQYDLGIERAGGIDLQILGIGMNGHIGFNEPGTPFGSRAHVADISGRSLSDKAEFYRKTGLAPRRAVTLGIRNIMEARKVLLIAKGAAKRDVVKRAVLGPVSTEVPASVLQLHPDTVVVLDEAAASGLGA
jgi:glucosamine-6-phosphate deaminase